MQRGYKLKPTPQISEHTPGMTAAFTQHFDEQMRIYQRQLVLNLLDRRGSELRLSESFEEQLRRIQRSDIKYVAFDFHHHCRNGNFDNVAILVQQLAEDLQSIGFCMKDASGQIVEIQRGAIRTNCLDCLDRTNLVQSTLAKRSLEIQMQALGVVVNLAEINGGGLNDRKRSIFDRLVTRCLCPVYPHRPDYSKKHGLTTVTFSVCNMPELRHSKATLLAQASAK